MLSLACVALGGWLVVAPALPKAGPVAVEPPTNLDAMRDLPGRGAASPTPRRASDATLLAALPVQPAVAGGAEKPVGRCGEDQAPAYADPLPEEDGGMRARPVLAKPAGVGYTGAQRRVDAALRATGDPFDSAVADALNVDNLRTPDDRIAALVQDALSADDPRLYALAFSVCKNAEAPPMPDMPGAARAAGEPGMRACSRLDPRRWAGRDPGNAVPWLYALERADVADDRVGQHEALQQLGTTSRFQMDFGATAAAVARLHPADDSDLTGQTFLVMQAAQFELWPSFSGITTRCKDKAGGDAAMAAICEHVADVLFDHSDSMLTRSVGASVHKLATGDASRLDRAHAERKELADKWAARVSDGVDAPPCDRARRFLQHFVLVGKVGEVEAMRKEIASRTPRTETARE